MSGSELFWATYFMLSGMIVNVALVMALALFLVLWLAGLVEDAQRRQTIPPRPKDAGLPCLNVCEYTDELTGIRMTIDQDNPRYPGHPKITVICPEGRILSLEQINEALSRLRHRAGVASELFPDVLHSE